MLAPGARTASRPAYRHSRAVTPLCWESRPSDELAIQRVAQPAAEVRVTLEVCGTGADTGCNGPVARKYWLSFIQLPSEHMSQSMEESNMLGIAVAMAVITSAMLGVPPRQRPSQIEQTLGYNIL